MAVCREGFSCTKLDSIITWLFDFMFIYTHQITWKIIIKGLYFNPPNGNFACAFLDNQDYLLIIFWIRWICWMRLPKISISIIFCMSQNKIKPHELFVSNHMTELNFVKKCWVLLIIDKMCRDMGNFLEKCQYKMHTIKHNNTHLSSINLSWELKKHPINRPPIRIKSCI